ncbi:mannose-ethanolamine phosphotransferase gpi13 [Coemansia sp. RSA 485]|nr:mannose-ethanolamine phosphotransferase gpi13 [Coemansia sp. RSA 485]
MTCNFAGSAMVRKNVGAERLHRDWDIIVAHGLGVDHCGHRFGPDHLAISQKLDQMNRTIELIVQAINRSHKRTALFVFGDHGMETKGDHGGDGPHEVDAALWVYSNAYWRSSESSERVARVLEVTEADLDNVSSGAHIAAPRLRSVPQIDLVPTLSLALGLHVPFNNLGAAIPEFFAGDDVGPDAEWKLLAAVRVNTAQTMRYLETYMKSTKSHGFSDKAVLAWRDMYARAETSYHELRALTAHSGGARGQPEVMQFEESVAAQYYVFMRVVLGTLRQMWAQFDAVLIVAGLLVLAALLAALVAVVVARAWRTSVGGGVAGAVAARSLGLLLSRNAVTHALQHQALAAALTAVVHGLAVSSNSFMFRKDSVVLYLAQTLALALALAVVKSMRASMTEQQRAGAVCGCSCAQPHTVIFNSMQAVVARRPRVND